VRTGEPDPWDGRTYRELAVRVRMFDRTSNSVLWPTLPERAQILSRTEDAAALAWYDASGPASLAAVSGSVDASQGPGTLGSHGWLVRYLDRLENASRFIQDWSWPASLRRLALQRYRRIDSSAIPSWAPLTLFYSEVLAPSLLGRQASLVADYWAQTRQARATGHLLERRQQLATRARTSEPTRPPFASPEVIPSLPPPGLGQLSYENGQGMRVVEFVGSSIAAATDEPPQWIDLAELAALYPHLELQTLIPWPRIVVLMDASERTFRGMDPERKRTVIADVTNIVLLARGIGVRLSARDPGTRSDGGVFLLEQVVLKQILVAHAGAVLGAPRQAVAAGTEALLRKSLYAPSSEQARRTFAHGVSARRDLARFLATGTQALRPEALRLIAPDGATDPLGDLGDPLSLSTQAFLDMLQGGRRAEETTTTGPTEARVVEQMIRPEGARLRQQWLQAFARAWLADVEAWQQQQGRLSALQREMLRRRLLRWDARSAPEPGTWLSALLARQSAPGLSVQGARAIARLRDAAERYALFSVLGTEADARQVRLVTGGVASYPFGIFSVDEVMGVLAAQANFSQGRVLRVQERSPGALAGPSGPADARASALVLRQDLPLPGAVGYFEKRRLLFDSQAFLTAGELSARRAGREAEFRRRLAEGDRASPLVDAGLLSGALETQFEGRVGSSLWALFTGNPDAQGLAPADLADSAVGQGVARGLLRDYDAQRDQLASRLLGIGEEPSAEQIVRQRVSKVLLRRDAVLRYTAEPPVDEDAGRTLIGSRPDKPGLLQSLLLSALDVLEAIEGNRMQTRQTGVPREAMPETDARRWHAQAQTEPERQLGETAFVTEAIDTIDLGEATQLCLGMLARGVRGAASLYRLVLPADLSGWDAEPEETSSVVAETVRELRDVSRASARAAVVMLVREGTEELLTFEPLLLPLSL